MNDTLLKFGYPDSLVHAYAHWAVVLRPRQVTLGSLVAVCTEPVRAFPEASAPAFAELRTVTGDVERALRSLFRHDRINWLMLMMVDPDVHFHVLPRYAQPRVFEGATFADAAWPGPPDLKSGADPDPALRSRLLASLRDAW